MTESIKMTGYKATNADMTCQPDMNKPAFKFELGTWYEVEGDLVECQNGFHFCEHPSGVWSYYNNHDTRIFKVEAEDVLPKKSSPGADRKRVCRRIRLVEEIVTNTGDSNTGYRNTGYSNTGDSNTGYRNTGDSNTGDYNTGDSNTGYRNTGSSNTGDSNTGNRNTGDSNTGNRNTGDSNTGDYNTGDSNTGDYNATNFSTGFFCVREPLVICFDVQTSLTREMFFDTYPEYQELGAKLNQDAEIDFMPFANLPGITPEKLKTLHEKHIAARKNTNV